jgi:hypothetical protein
MSRRAEPYSQVYDSRPISSSYGTAFNGNGVKPLPKATGTVQPEESTPLLPQHREKYSSFSTAQKTFIVFTAAFASTFSPFSSNIYYPAINSIAHDLHVTASMMNLTITAYMVS